MPVRRAAGVEEATSQNVGLVDDRVVPGSPWRPIVSPCERWLDDDGLWHAGRAVGRGDFRGLADCFAVRWMGKRMLNYNVHEEQQPR